MTVQIDTNVLTRLAQPTHPLHAAAASAIRNLQSAGHPLCVVPQNLYEFWVVATRPLGDNGLGLAVPEVIAELDRLKRTFALLADSPALLPAWEKLVVAFECKGKMAHDARIVAAMNVHGVKHLLTFNVKDFLRYTDLNVIDPAAVGVLPPPPIEP